MIGPSLMSSPSVARLDPDGNEIPSDEEEELERQRTADRLRNHNRSDAARRVLMPMSRSSFTVDDDIDYVPRVRLHPRDLEYEHPGLRDNTPGVRERRGRENSEACAPQFYGSDVPFFVDPLPMPLEDMVPDHFKPNPKRTNNIRVHKHATLAGR